MNSFLFNHLKFQIAATVILLIVEIIYFFRPKLNLLSNKIFSVLMISSAAYLLFDYATVFALVYYDFIPEWVVKFTHQGFIVFLDIALSCIYLYLNVLNRNQKRFSKNKTIFISLLYLLCLLTIIFAPIQYYIEEDGIYSYGLMVNCVYLIIILYSFLTIYESIRTLKKSKHKRQQKYTLFTMGIWLGFGITQIFLPKLLISSVGIAAMILLMFLSLENPSEYIDKETSSFNYSALKSVLSEYTNKEQPFAIINVDLEDIPIIENHFGNDILTETLIEIKTFIEKTFHVKTYRLERTSLSFILNEKQISRLDKYLEILCDRFTLTWNLKNTSIHLNAHADVVCCPTDFPFDGKISDLIDFVENCHNYTEDSGFLHRIDDTAKNNRNRKFKIIQIISDAIENDGIEMFYQPIYNLKEKKYTNAEALVRLKDNHSIGFISPEEFIPIAEQNGLIMQLSNLIFNKVFKFMNEQKFYEKSIQHIEVNLSGLQSVDADLPRLMKNLMEKYNINPESVNLEITESIAITSGYMLKKNMDELKKYGCTFSMDDFGTGYSNLSQIAKVDFELIKIDKSLLWPCFEKNNKDIEKSRILLENMIEMILKMGRKIVVEGIETKEQYDYLATLGITFAQGFYFSKPLQEKNFIDFIISNN